MSNDSEQNLKVPSQVFKWFEKMKSNYENSVQSVLSRFEDYNKEQQNRLDNTNQQYIQDLKEAHNSQLEMSQKNNQQLLEDISYYKQQIAQQQQTIEQLNTRYDAVIACLVTDKNKQVDIHTIFNDSFLKDIQSAPSNEPETSQEAHEKIIEDVEVNVDEQHTTIESSTENDDSNVDNDNQPAYQSSDNHQPDNDELYQLALEQRDLNNKEAAFSLFKQASELEHPPSMGAMGRSYFLGEGVEENQTIGLAWLIKAAVAELPQAIVRVKQFEENDFELFQAAQELVNNDSI